MDCVKNSRRVSPPKRPTTLLALASALAVCALHVTACGGDDPDDTTHATAGRDESSLGADPISGDNVVAPGTAPVKYSSPQGLFAVTWPSGCNSLRTRKPTGAPPDAEFPGDNPTELSVYCDRAGAKNEGCAVRGYYNETAENGGPPHPRMVTARVESTLTTYGVEIVSQTPGTWGALQGVDVLCRESGGTGEVWVRGLLAGPHYYLLIAWNQSGGLFEDPVYQAFFESFSVFEAADHAQ